MDEAIEFVKKYIDLHYQAYLANHTEPDTKLYTQKYAEFKNLFINDFFTLHGQKMDLMNRPEPVDQKWLETGQKMVKYGNIVKARIYQIKKYQDSKYGELFRAYLSSQNTSKNPQNTFYEDSVFFAKINGKFKVVALYHLDLLDQRGSKIKLGPLTWITFYEPKIGQLGKLLEVKKNEEPQNPEHKNEYNID